MSASVIYVTTASFEQARQIGRALVDERLVACANILERATSIYRWQGKVHEDEECVLFAKTATDRVDRVIERVKELHEYECPCVVSWPIGAGDPAYLNWIGEMTDPENE